MSRLNYGILSIGLMVSTVSAFADNSGLFDQAASAVRGVWAPLDKSSGPFLFAKAKLTEKLQEKGLHLVEESLVVKPELSVKPLNILRSTVNVEYQYYPDLNTYNVTFEAQDERGQTIAGSSFLQQVSCQKEKVEVDCDSLAADKAFGVFGDEIVVYMTNSATENEPPKVLDFNLR